MRPRRKHLRYWFAITLLGITLSIGVLSLFRAIGTIGKPFAGFFFGPNLLVGVGQRAEWPGIQNGLRSLDHILEVDGTPIKSSDELLEHISIHEPGDQISYQVDRKGLLREIEVPVTRYTLNDFIIVFLAPFLMGLLFVAFGGILFFAGLQARGSLVYLSLCCLVGLFCMALYEAYTTFAFFRVILIYPLIGALSVHLFSLFPETRIFRPRVRAGVIAVYVFAFALVIWRQVALSDALNSVWLSKFSSFYVLLVLIADVYLLVRAYQRTSNQALRDKIKVIGAGLFIASFVLAAWSLNFLLVTKSFYLDEGVLLASVFPLFMGYAILRKNVLGLDRVIRLSLSYGIAAAVLLVIYLGVVGTIQQLLPQAMAGRYFGWFMVILAGAGAFLFNLVRRRINQWVHRFLFRSQFHLGEAFRKLDRLLITGLGPQDLSDRVGKTLSEVLDLEKTAVICLSRGQHQATAVRTFRWTQNPHLERWLPLFENEGFLEEIRKQARPIEVQEFSNDHPDRFYQSMAKLKSHQIEITVPCVSSKTLFGLLLLGTKHSKERFDRTDRRLLQSLAERIGLVLENVELAKESERQTRLAAIGRMASVLIHDIKNPLSTIKISAGSIKKRFREGDHCYELATYVEEEVDRMDHAVQEILHFAKPAGVVLKRCSLNELVHDVYEKFRPLFEISKVNFSLELSPKEVWIHVDRNRIARAIENLVINAKEATKAGDKVKLKTVQTTSEHRPSHVKVVVEDTGKGMDEAIRDQVFVPFFTTKANGTGLGLAIVKQVMTEHGAEMNLESRPGKGTRFELRFPIHLS